MYLNRNYLYIDHTDSINVADHVNDGNLHLNKYGKAVLAKDFTNFLGNMDWWDNDSGSNLSYCEINHNYHLNQYEGFLNPNQIYLDELSDSKLNEGNDVSVLSGNQSFNLLDESLLCNNDLKQIRLKNPNNLIIAQININSLRNKFDFLVQLMFNNVDILLVSETKIDASFPNAQFHIAGYTIYRRDRNGNGGGLLLYVKEDIPSSLLNLDTSYEAMYIEINVRKKKWLIGCSYNPKQNMIAPHLEQVGQYLDKYLTNYDQFLLLGDMNADPDNQTVIDFREV